MAKKQDLLAELDRTDVHIGIRIRLRRAELAMPQKVLADRLGTHFQTVQKYELGANRLRASMLRFVAKELGVSVSYFFEGLSEDPEGASMDPERRRIIPEFAQDLMAILPSHREALLDLVRTMAQRERDRPGSSPVPSM